MSAVGNDTRFCREHAFGGYPLFRVSSLFAPRISRPLTALYALFDLLDRIARLAGEEGAAHTQLAWWRHECLVADPRASSHPALRELFAEGGAGLDRDALARLLEQVELRLEQPAMPDAAALVSFCERQGRAQLELELALWGSIIDDARVMSTLAARRGIYLLMGNSLRTGGTPDAWWAPLDALAREALPRAELFSPGREPETRRVISAALLECDPFTAQITDISIEDQKVGHIFVIDSLLRRALLRAGRRGSAMLPRELSRVRVGDLLGAWTLARRVNRRR